MYFPELRRYFTELRIYFYPTAIKINGTVKILGATADVPDATATALYGTSDMNYVTTNSIRRFYRNTLCYCGCTSLHCKGDPSPIVHPESFNRPAEMYSALPETVGGLPEIANSFPKGIRGHSDYSQHLVAPLPVQWSQLC